MTFETTLVLLITGGLYVLFLCGIGLIYRWLRKHPQDLQRRSQNQRASPQPEEKMISNG